MYDCLICDMEVVGPIVLEIKEKEFTGNKQEAKECVMQLERVPMPLYFVFEEKREKYKAKLNELIDMFFCEFDL